MGAPTARCLSATHDLNGRTLARFRRLDCGWLRERSSLLHTQTVLNHVGLSLFH